jgi:hypothetical protein
MFFLTFLLPIAMAWIQEEKKYEILPTVHVETIATLMFQNAGHLWREEAMRIAYHQVSLN